MRQIKKITFGLYRTVHEFFLLLYRFLSLKPLIEHLKIEHNKNMHEEHHEFPSFEEFMKWKREEETRTKSFYVQQCGPCTRCEARFWYFYCNRSGMYRMKKEGKRASKVQGSCKLGEYCTAHMKVTQGCSTENVTVEYYSTHHNHKPANDIVHLQMPEELRVSIAAKLLQGVTVDKILDEIRDSVSKTGLQREHLTTRQDVFNIKRQYNTEGIERHANDHSSVCAWVEEMKSMDFDPVIAFKKQDMPTSEQGVLPGGFMLAFQTEYQKEVMKAFGNNVVCIDATHGTNIYDFLLVTVMVIDDFGEGIPVGWAITSREDTCMLTYFFKALRERTGPLRPSVFMSDDAVQYWNAWSCIYGDNGTRKLLCAWHIDRAWRKALQEHIADVEARIELYHHLQTLLAELDPAQLKCSTTHNG